MSLAPLVYKKSYFDNAAVLMVLSGFHYVCFVDVYLCAVLICSLGLLSIFLFTLVLTYQYFHRRHRLKGKTLICFPPETSHLQLCFSLSIQNNAWILSGQHDFYLLLSPQPVIFWSSVQKAGTVKTGAETMNRSVDHQQY